MARKRKYIKSWPCNNLGELVRFLNSIYPEGYTIRDVAERCGTTVQNLSQMFTKDNMRLKFIEEIAGAYGYTLSLYFPVKEKMDIIYVTKKREWPNAGNLQGLAQYIADSNITVNYMSQRIGHGNNVLTNAFNTGNISISVLYEVLANLNIDVIWEFKKNQTE